MILPIADYLELLEDLEDLATIAERRNETTIPLEDVLTELNLLQAIRLSLNKLLKNNWHNY